MRASNEGRICAVSLALVVAVVWGACVWAMGVATIYTDTYAREMVKVLGSIYYGYAPGHWAGAFIGLGWALADGFVGTFLIVSLYNLVTRRYRRRPGPGQGAVEV